MAWTYLAALMLFQESKGIFEAIFDVHEQLGEYLSAMPPFVMPPEL
jgi:hypothetical protein